MRNTAFAFALCLAVAIAFPERGSPTVGQIETVITSHVYAGRPDPNWKPYSGEVPLHLENLVRRAPVTEVSPTKFSEVAFQGYTVASSDAIHTYTVFEGLVIVDKQQDGISTTRYHHADTSEVEKMIWDSAPRDVQQIITFSRSLVSELQGDVVVDYENSEWNSDPNIRLNNNGYNFATGIITNTNARPGKKAWSEFQRDISSVEYPEDFEYTGTKLVESVVADGFEKIDIPRSMLNRFCDSLDHRTEWCMFLYVQETPKTEEKVLLSDFHFVRQVGPNAYAHKISTNPVSAYIPNQDEMELVGVFVGGVNHNGDVL